MGFIHTSGKLGLYCVTEPICLLFFVTSWNLFLCKRLALIYVWHCEKSHPIRATSTWDFECTVHTLHTGTRNPEVLAFVYNKTNLIICLLWLEQAGNFSFFFKSENIVLSKPKLSQRCSIFNRKIFSGPEWNFWSKPENNPKIAKWLGHSLGMLRCRFMSLLCLIQGTDFNLDLWIP